MNKDALVQFLKEKSFKEAKHADSIYDDYLSENLVISEQHTIDDVSQRSASSDLSNELDDQLDIDLDNRKLLETIDFSPKEVIAPGAVAKVNGMYWVFAYAMAPFQFEGDNYIGLSVNAPIYSSVAGKKAGDEFGFKGNTYKIEEVQ